MTGGEPLVIGQASVAPGTRHFEALPVARLFTGNLLSLPVAVVRGRRDGPRIWLSAALHGDELNGMEIIRELLEQLDPERLRGAVLPVPVVNVFGLVQRTRYLPDRRDLNRAFPGSRRGSLASRLAELFVREIVERCEIGIDLHTGSLHRTNLPQVRFNPGDAVARRLAFAFGAPLLYPQVPIRGSLRETAGQRGIPLLLYEAGEPLRFNRRAIRYGSDGVMRVLAALGMWDGELPAPGPTTEATHARWLRAARSGVFHLGVELGEPVEEGQVLGTITDPVADPFSTEKVRVRTPLGGIVVGFTNNPLVHQGDALIHVAAPALPSDAVSASK